MGILVPECLVPGSPKPPKISYISYARCRGKYLQGKPRDQLNWALLLPGCLYICTQHLIPITSTSFHLFHLGPRRYYGNFEVFRFDYCEGPPILLGPFWDFSNRLLRSLNSALDLRRFFDRVGSFWTMKHFEALNESLLRTAAFVNDHFRQVSFDDVGIGPIIN